MKSKLIRQILKNDITSLKLSITKIKNGYFYTKPINMSNRDFIKETFCSDIKEYDNLYSQVVNGSGNEDSNMNNIISSALFAFLFFSRVTTDNPIIIDEIRYTKVCFEFKNRTLLGTSDFAPSNIDVVLTDENIDHILFIESKYGEYFYDQKEIFGKNKESGISIQYKQKGSTVPIIQELLKNQTWIHEEDNKIVCYEYENDKYKKHYYYGIKQLLTHISGISNFLKGNFCEDNHKHSHDNFKIEIEKKYQTAKISLIEIVFDFNVFNNVASLEFLDYQKMHNKLCEVVKKFALGFDIKPLMTYQEIFKDNKEYIFNMPNNIKVLYKMQEG